MKESYRHRSKHSSRSASRERDRDRNRHKEQDRYRERERDRDRERIKEKDRYRDKDRDRNRDRDHERSRERSYYEKSSRDSRHRSLTSRSHSSNPKKSKKSKKSRKYARSSSSSSSTSSRSTYSRDSRSHSRRTTPKPISSRPKTSRQPSIETDGSPAVAKLTPQIKEIDLMDFKVQKALETIEEDSFEQKSFSSSRGDIKEKPATDKVIIDLKADTVTVPKASIVSQDAVLKVQIFHPNFIGDQELKAEKWLRKLHNYRQKYFQE